MDTIKVTLELTTEEAEQVLQALAMQKSRIVTEHGYGKAGKMHLDSVGDPLFRKLTGITTQIQSALYPYYH